MNYRKYIMFFGKNGPAKGRPIFLDKPRQLKKPRRMSSGRSKLIYFPSQGMLGLIPILGYGYVHVNGRSLAQ